MKILIFTLPLLFCFNFNSQAQANTTLSNLSLNTKINASLKPKTTGFYDLGKIDSAWKNLFLTGNVFVNGRQFVENHIVGENIFIGGSTGYNNTTGDWNISLGNGALALNTSGNYNTALGSYSLVNNITGGYNTGLGSFSLYANKASYNTALGSYSLYSNTTGAFNTAIGNEALYNNTEGYWNTAIGRGALSGNQTGNGNAALGSSTLIANTTGAENTAIGNAALKANQNGSYNTVVGSQALNSNTTQSKNTAIGYAAGNNFSSSASTYLGHGATPAVSGIDNSTAIGFSSKVTASNQVRIGNTAVTSIGGQVGWSTLSDGRFKKNIKEDVPGLLFINKLKPVTYNVEVKKLEKFLGKNDNELTASKTSYDAAEKIIRTGFVAQEVEKAAKDIKYDFDGVNAPQNEKDHYSLVYADFVPSLVKAVQELSKLNEEKDKLIADLNERVSKLENAGLTGTSLGTSKLLTNAGDKARLDQNMPNPSGTSTTISYYIPAAVKSAQLAITDMNGRTIKQQTLPTKAGSITFDTNNLLSGTYSYTLYCDGIPAGSKKNDRNKININSLVTPISTLNKGFIAKAL